MSSGSFKKTRSFLNLGRRKDLGEILEKYAELGVQALRSNTPADSGTTAASWGYNIVQEQNSARIEWTNSNVNKGVSIALILQLGHGTGTGGYVQGRDYINPALRPVFDKLSASAVKEVCGT